MPRFFPLAILFLAALPASVVVGQNYPADGTLLYKKDTPGILRLLLLTCPPSRTDSNPRPIPFPGTPLPPFDPDPTLTPLNPPRGSLSTPVGTSTTYTPQHYKDGNFTFVWEAINDINGSTMQYTAQITVTSVDNPPVFASTTATGSEFRFNENQSIVGTVVVHDPDSSPSTQTNLLRLDINGAPGHLFDANFVSTDASGEYHTFSLFYTPASPPNFEAVPETYTIELNATHWNSGGLMVDPPTTQAMGVRLIDVNEVPVSFHPKTPFSEPFTKIKTPVKL